MSKYNDLVNILDKLRKEAPTSFKRYHPDANQPEQLIEARSRAFIHLFLKVKFGKVDFLEREQFITDGGQDGGLDAYFIDQENKKLYFLQSKFRATGKNFENKEITLEELLAMDIERIANGESIAEDGRPYSNKIQRFIKELQGISDLPRYQHRIILLANLKDISQTKIKKLTGGFAAEIFNYERCYNELVFPLISGTYYNISELKITINVNSQSGGHRIDYDVKTKTFECNVNALFVPTIEIAQILSKYKNSILKFNPRSYLDLVGNVNTQIAKSITHIGTNEFALFNNGITMLSDNTDYSDKVGRKNRAEILVTNPQIINGGQTAYTLSVIYDSIIKENKPLTVFEGKEVLLKIITFSEEQPSSAEDKLSKLDLIEQISIATNQQSPVTEADRRANDKVQIELQKAIFEAFGLYYERKRGEYGDGLKNGYIDRNKIIDRDLFLRICLSAKNNPTAARRGKGELFYKPTFDNILPNINDFRKYIFAYKGYEVIPSVSGSRGNAGSIGRHAVVTVLASKFSSALANEDFDNIAKAEVAVILKQ
jgi:hypothetical protein